MQHSKKKTHPPPEITGSLSVGENEAEGESGGWGAGLKGAAAGQGSTGLTALSNKEPFKVRVAEPGRGRRLGCESLAPSPPRCDAEEPPSVCVPPPPLHHAQLLGWHRACGAGRERLGGRAQPRRHHHRRGGGGGREQEAHTQPGDLRPGELPKKGQRGLGTSPRGQEAATRHQAHLLENPLARNQGGGVPTTTTPKPLPISPAWREAGDPLGKPPGQKTQRRRARGREPPGHSPKQGESRGCFLTG